MLLKDPNIFVELSRNVGLFIFIRQVNVETESLYAKQAGVAKPLVHLRLPISTTNIANAIEMLRMPYV